MNWQTAPYGISEVCERTGLSPRTVRYYEELGLLPGVRRRAGGRRVYGDEEIERLHFIQRLKALGEKRERIKQLRAEAAVEADDVLDEALAAGLPVAKVARLAGSEAQATR